MIFKVVINNIFTGSDYDKFVRVRLGYEFLRMALNFIFSVSLFNWFARKYLLIIFSLFESGGLLALLMAMIY